MHDIALGPALAKHKSELAGLSKSLLDGNVETFAEGMAGLLTSLATGVPALGVVAKQGIAKAFALSSAAKLKRDLEALEREEDRQQFADQIAAPLEELIGQAFLQLVRTQQHASSEIIEALGGLREEFESFRADFAQRVAQTSVVVDRIVVSDNGIGFRVTGRTAASIAVGTIVVTKNGVGFEV